MLHGRVSVKCHLSLVIFHILFVIFIYVYSLDFRLLKNFFCCHGVLIKIRNALTLAGVPLWRRADADFFRLECRFKGSNEHHLVNARLPHVSYRQLFQAVCASDGSPLSRLEYRIALYVLGGRLATSENC